MIKYHYFDVDHTLTSRSTGRHFLVSAVCKRELSPFLLLSMPIYYLRYRYGRLHAGNPVVGIPRFKGMSKETLMKISEEAYATYTRHDIYEQAYSLIKSVKSEGGSVYLASSSVNVILEPLAADIGVDGVISTEFEYIDGICTGVFIGGPALGKEKRYRVMAHINKRGIPPNECAFYSDSYHDIPIMDEVGKPVAINPDRRLLKYAKKNKWEIIHFGH